MSEILRVSRILFFGSDFIVFYFRMDMIKRLEAARDKEVAKRDRTLAKLEDINKRIRFRNEKNKSRRQEVNRMLANKQARPLVDLVTGK